jgi:hypothetical protein
MGYGSVDAGGERREVKFSFAMSRSDSFVRIVSCQTPFIAITAISNISEKRCA